MTKPFAFMALSAVLTFGMATFTFAGSGDKKGSDDLTKGPGLTNRSGAGGGMGEDTTPKGSPEGPRGAPLDTGAPGYEGADKGKKTSPTMGSQSDFHPPAGPPEDPVPRAGTGR